VVRRAVCPSNTKSETLFTPRDGKIVRFDSYWDLTEALETAGVLE
jgi:ketosteroid isomerase-like protein